MTDVFLRCYRRSLSPELLQSLEDRIRDVEEARYRNILALPVVRDICSQAPASAHGGNEPWGRHIQARADSILSNLDPPTSVENAHLAHTLFLAAVAALQAFLQSNVTGPPLDFDPATLLLPSGLGQDGDALKADRRDLISSLSSDGVAAYKLTPNVELFCFADALLGSRKVSQSTHLSSWAKLRADFLHQRMLSEISSALQEAVYKGLRMVQSEIETAAWAKGDRDVRSTFLLEEAAIQLHHGFDKRARQALDEVTAAREFVFALTGLLGKRTKYQEHDLSQLLVLAKSSSGQEVAKPDETTSQAVELSGNKTKPENLDLEDDTLLESISFTKTPKSAADMQAYDHLPRSLQDLDPNDQPILQPLDSITLLAYASSITNTSPADGLIREETLPYATRVLEGGSSNWQVYTQALLVRSRIEGYRSRTVERGLLQLQALVDQVIADTTHEDSAKAEQTSGSSTFIPRAKDSESAPANERLLYIYQLNTPTRWELEAELASRWVTLGGLRSALEIYERLEMWAEAALCLAATDREDKARAIVRRQLFHSTSGDDSDIDLETEKWQGKAREPPPADASRLYCILGDIDMDPSMYETAWTVSKSRYARAQRSLGRHYFAKNDFVAAADAYSKSIAVNQLNHASWFVLGCCLLELSAFDKAAQAFSRTVQLADTDAEAWSNLATALLKRGPTLPSQAPPGSEPIDENDASTDPTPVDPYAHTRDALAALKRAARLKHDDSRIWDNLLTVAASTVPPSYTDIVTAMRRVIALRGPAQGERAVDETILDHLLQHVISTSADEHGRTVYDASRPGLQRMVVKLIDESVVPLITASAHLWKIVAKLSLWRGKPGTALEAQEKAWRAVTSQPGWETGTQERWEEVADATVDLADAYESLGSMERTEGLSAGSGQVVLKGWAFKARSAVRGIMNRARDTWEGTSGWEKLEARLMDLKS